MNAIHHLKHRGAVLLLALVFLGIFSAMAFALLGSLTAFAQAQQQRVRDAQALALAEGGIDKAAYALNANASYTGETGTALGTGTFSIVVTSIDANTKSVLATGYVPNATTPRATQSVRVTLAINATAVSFHYGVQVGAGGLSMGNGSQINGSLFSDGSVSGGGTITGDAIVAGGTATTPEQQWTTQNADVALGNSSARAYLAQSFVPSSTGPLNYVSLNLKKVGSPGDLTVKIVPDDDGNPATSAITSGTLAASSVTNSYGFVNVPLSSSPTLNAGARYWIVAIASVNSSKYFVWGGDSTDAYAAGTGKASANGGSSHAVWTALNTDLDFKVFFGGIITSLSGVTVNGNATAHELSSCTIGADAYYMTLSGCTVGGTTHPGTADTSPVPLPISDAQIAQWEAAAAAGGVQNSDFSLTNGTATTLGPKKINGNMTISDGSSVTLTGPVWVRGNLSISNNAILTISPLFGASGVVVVVDDPSNLATSGKVDISNNAVVSGNGTSGSALMILSTNSASDAVRLSNNGGSVILYASNGTIAVQNNANASQVTGYELNLSNNTSVTYSSGLQNQNFSNGPGGAWIFVPGSYAIIP